MGTPAIAEKMKVSIEDANKILTDFFNGFPRIKVWMDESLNDARQYGYVEDLWGRRRHLPDISLPKYVVTDKSQKSTFNPILFTSGNNYLIESSKVAQYKEKLESAKTKKDVDKITQQAVKDGLIVQNNSSFIARAERQCVNARIQGGAATMTKRAMILISNDEKMKEYGFRLLIAVHDELIGECPIEYASEARDRLSYLMQEAAKPEVMIRMKSDAIIFPCWYYDELSADILDKRDKMLSDMVSYDDVVRAIKEEFSELTSEQIDEILSEK